MRAVIGVFWLVPFLGMFLIGADACWGWEFHSESHQTQKIYVSPDQVEITDRGILFYSESGETPILGTLLSYDEQGSYIEIAPYGCPYGHEPRCWICKGCHDPECTARCRCAD